MFRQAIAAALLTLAPVVAAAQAQLKDLVLIRALADPSLQVVGSASLDHFVFTQASRDQPVPFFNVPQKGGSAAPPGASVQPALHLELELVAMPEQPLDAAVLALRELVKRELAVELSMPKRKLPPGVMDVWADGLPAFKGVVSQITARYTLFLEDGTPARAVVNISLRTGCEAKSKKKNGDGARDGDCS